MEIINSFIENICAIIVQTVVYLQCDLLQINLIEYDIKDGKTIMVWNYVSNCLAIDNDIS